MVTLEPAADFGFVAAVGRLVVLLVFGQVGLFHPAAREIVAILVTGAMAELLGAAVMVVA
jgi:hypothetical protein